MATYRNIRKVLNLPTLSASPSSGVNGEMYFNTADLALYIYDGAWKKVTQSAATPTYDWTTTAQQAKIQSSDVAAGDQFGTDVTIHDDNIVVGAKFENANGAEAGAAYFFTRSGTSWTQQQKIVSSDISVDDHFGSSVDMDATTLVVGAKYANNFTGAAYVFTLSGTTWTQQAKLTTSDGASGDGVGEFVKLSGDTVIVGSRHEGGSNQGAVYVFTRSGTSWSQQAKLQPSDLAANDEFCPCDIDGDTIIVGAYGHDSQGTNRGAAYVFTRSGTTWTQQAKLLDPASGEQYRFGLSVAINNGTIAVGQGAAFISGVMTGAVHIFTGSGSSWSHQATLSASDGEASDFFGSRVELDGDVIVVGANREDTGGSSAGSGYIFTRSGTSWTQAKKIQSSDVAADDNFSNSVDIDASTGTVIAGAFYEDTGGNGAGSAYTFVAGT